MSIDYEKYKNFEYTSRIKGKELSFDTHDWSVEKLLKEFKKNKSNVIAKFDCSISPDNVFNHLLHLKSYPYIFIFSKDWKFCVGYRELQILYRWIYKGYPIINSDGDKYYFNKLSDTLKESILSSTMRVRTYDSANVNTLIRRHFGMNYTLDKK